MSTEAQLAANRANALKSTGPQTPEGKARSAANAFSHGLTASKMLLLPDEDPAEFHIFREGMLAELAPESPLDLHFAEKIIANAWRLRRIPDIETRLYLQSEKSDPDSDPDSAQPPGFNPAAAWLDSLRSAKFANLSRHESHVHRMLCRDFNTYMNRRRQRETAIARQAKSQAAPKRPIINRLNDILLEMNRETSAALRQAGIPADERDMDDDVL